MLKRIVLMLLALSLAVLSGCAAMESKESAAPSRADAPASSIVLGYYPSWDAGLPPSAIQYDQFTHLCHAFVSSDVAGAVKTEGNLPSRELTRLAHSHGVKVLVSLGGMDSGDYFNPMMRDPEAAERFIQGVVDLVIAYEYDGVDIDWEFPKDDIDKANLTQMAKRFRALLDERKPGSLITTAQAGVDWAGQWLDEAALRDVFDLVAVMGYDMHGPWTGHAGHNAMLRADPKDRADCQAIKSLPAYMDYWEKQKGFPKSKLLVGLPCYGRGFPVSAWYEEIPRDAKWPHAYIRFTDVSVLLADGWVRHWDADVSVPWLSKPGVAEIITYEDEESAALKGRWSAERGYGGIFFWEISQDFDGGRHRIVEAATTGYRAGAAAGRE